MKTTELEFPIDAQANRARLGGVNVDILDASDGFASQARGVEVGYIIVVAVEGVEEADCDFPATVFPA
jgi:hypothetical protein